MTSAEDRQITILKEITIPRVTTLDAASQAMLMDTMREIQALNPDILASAVYYSACEGLVRAARALEYVYAAAAPDPLLCPSCASHVRNVTRHTVSPCSWLPKAWGLTVCIGSPALEEALGPDLNFLCVPCSLCGRYALMLTPAPWLHRYGPSQWDHRLKGRK